MYFSQTFTLQMRRRSYLTHCVKMKDTNLISAMKVALKYPEVDILKPTTTQFIENAEKNSVVMKHPGTETLKSAIKD